MLVFTQLCGDVARLLSRHLEERGIGAMLAPRRYRGEATRTHAWSNASGMARPVFLLLSLKAAGTGLNPDPG